MKKEKEKKKKKRAEEMLPTLPEPTPPEPPEPPEPNPAPKPRRVTTNPASDSQTFERVMERLGGKWKLRIVWALRDGTGKRYRDVKLELPAITDMMLSQSLRELCEHGLVQREQYLEVPARVEYVLTPHGQGVLPAIRALLKWGAALPD